MVTFSDFYRSCTRSCSFPQILEALKRLSTPAERKRCAYLPLTNGKPRTPADCRHIACHGCNWVTGCERVLCDARSAQRACRRPARECRRQTAHDQASFVCDAMSACQHSQAYAARRTHIVLKCRRRPPLVSFCLSVQHASGCSVVSGRVRLRQTCTAGCRKHAGVSRRSGSARLGESCDRRAWRRAWSLPSVPLTRFSSPAPVCAASQREERHREECLEAAIASVLDSSGAGDSGGDGGGGVLIAFNLFALEAWHIAEALGAICPCACVRVSCLPRVLRIPAFQPAGRTPSDAGHPTSVQELRRSASIPTSFHTPHRLLSRGVSTGSRRASQTRSGMPLLEPPAGAPARAAAGVLQPADSTERSHQKDTEAAYAMPPPQGRGGPLDVATVLRREVGRVAGDEARASPASARRLRSEPAASASPGHAAAVRFRRERLPAARVRARASSDRAARESIRRTLPVRLSTPPPLPLPAQVLAREHPHDGILAGGARLGDASRRRPGWRRPRRRAPAAEAAAGG